MEAFPEFAEIDVRCIYRCVCCIFGWTAEAERCRESRYEGVAGDGGGTILGLAGDLGLDAVLRMLEQAARRKPAELLEEFRAEIVAGIGIAGMVARAARGACR